MRTFITALAFALAALVAAPASAENIPACAGVTSTAAKNACATFAREVYNEGGDRVESSN